MQAPSDMKTEVPAATAFTHWGTCPEPAMATFVMRRFGDGHPTVTTAATKEPERIKILDIGAGAGAQTKWLIDEGFIAVPIDKSSEAMRRLMSRTRDLSVGIVGDITNLDKISDDHFDCAVDVCCLQHLDYHQVRKALAEIRRVLKPGGWLFSMTANNNHSVTAFGDHFGRRESVSSVTMLYTNAGFRMEPLREQFHTYTGLPVGHWIVEAQKP